MFSRHVIHNTQQNIKSLVHFIAISSSISINTSIHFSPTKGSPSIRHTKVPYKVLLCGINGDQRPCQKPKPVSEPQTPVVSHFALQYYLHPLRVPLRGRPSPFPLPQRGGGSSCSHPSVEEERHALGQVSRRYLIYVKRFRSGFSQSSQQCQRRDHPNKLKIQELENLISQWINDENMYLLVSSIC